MAVFYSYSKSKKIFKKIKNTIFMSEARFNSLLAQNDAFFQSGFVVFDG